MVDYMQSEATTTTMTTVRRYRAFICYSQTDHTAAEELHRYLERYRVPRRLVGKLGATGAVPARLYPVFRDRDELAASADISERLRTALSQSEFLIVLCSPAAAQSRWVNAEIETFFAAAPDNSKRVLTILLAGEPSSGDPVTECFPSALRHANTNDPALLRRYPLAADFRPGRDDPADAELRLIAGLLGLEFDELKQREQESRLARLRVSLAVTGALAVAFAGLATFALQQRVEAHRAAASAEAAHQKAAEEAATSQAINDFLQKDLLAQASPDRQPDRDIKLKSVLDAAAKRIEGRFPHQPLVEAGIRTTLGETFSSLTEYAQAEVQYETALALLESQLGADDPKALRIRVTLTGVYMKLGKHAEAEKFGLETLERVRKVEGASHPDALRLMSNLAALYQRAGRLKEAETLSLEALKNQTRVLGSDNQDTLRTMANLGALRLVQGRLTEAEAMMTQVLEIMKRTLGSEHPLTLQTRANLSIVLASEGKFAEAEALQLELVEVSRKVLGPDHSSTISAMNGLAVTYHAQGRLAEAEALWRQVLEALQRTVGPEHPNTLKMMNNITIVLVDQNKLAQAEQMSRGILEIQKRKLGADTPDTLTTMHNLAVIIWNEARLDDAEAMERDALAGKRRVLDPEHVETIESMDTLAVIYRSQAKLAEAETLERDALAVATRTLGVDHAITRQAQRNLAIVIGKRGDLNGAHKILSDLLQRIEQIPDVPPDFRASCVAALAKTLIAQGQSAEAESILRKSVDAAKSASPLAWRKAEIRSLLGEALTLQNRFTQAESLVVSAFEDLARSAKSIPPIEKSVVRDCGDRVIQLYAAEGQNDKVQEWTRAVQLAESAASGSAGLTACGSRPE